MSRFRTTANRIHAVTTARCPLRVGMENEDVLLTTIPAGELVGAYGRESWVSV